MKDRKLATRYARALLAALPDPESRQRVEAFLVALGETLSTDRAIREALKDPATPRSERLRVLQAAARERGMPEQVSAFMATVVDHGRIDVLPAIATVYRELHEEEQGVVSATITTAKPMSPDMEERARGALRTLTGKKVRLTTAVDAELIGGAVTQVGSMVYDGSLRTQLQSLRRRMGQE